MKVGIQAFAALLAALMLAACGSQSTRVRYFSYLDEGTEYALSGKLDGLPFTATLQSGGRTAAQGDLTQSSADFTLTYLSPPALSGVRVDYDAETSELSVRLGELHATGEVYAALGAPALLLLTESPVSSARRDKVGSICFETMDGARRTLGTDGKPTHLTWSGDGRSVEVRVESSLVP